MTVPNIQNAHDPATRNIINRNIDVTNELGKRMQDLVAKGQLTPTQYATLIQTVNGLISKGEIKIDDIDKNNFKVDETMIAESLLKQITGETPIHSVPADESITTKKLTNNSVTPEKTSFLKVGKNLFNADTVEKNSVLTGTGITTPNVAYDTSDYIKINSNTNLTRSHRYLIDFYDSSKKYISSLPGVAPGNLPGTFKTPSNAAYLRASILKEYTGSFQIEYGSSATAFEKYSYTLSGIAPFSDSVNIVLPPQINAVVNHETSVYFENIIDGDYRDYHFDVVCNVGRHMRDRYWLVPTSAGSYPLTIRIFDKKTKTQIGESSSTVKVKAKSSGNSITKKALFIGDSTTFAGVYTNELINLFDSDTNMDVSLIGTMGTSPNLHEGRGGWRVNDYYTRSDSPFVFNGSFNFTQYMSTNNFSAVDHVNIHLGINDVFGQSTDSGVIEIVSTMFTQLDAMINSIHTYDSSIVVGIMVTIPPSYSQDAFGYDYLTGQTRWRYKQNWFILMSAMIDYFRNRETGKVHIIPTNVNIDTENNMVIANHLVANSRNDKLVPRMANGVHPADSGYFQMADTIYYWFKNFY